MPLFERKLALVLCFTLFVVETHATHLVGGSLTYKYVGKQGSENKYEILLKMYRDSYNSSTPFDPIVSIGVYEASNRNLVKILSIEKDYETDVSPPSGGSKCSFKPNVGIKEGIYRDTVTLPNTNSGFHVIHVRCCRNQLLNVVPNEGQTYYAFIPPSSYKNSSPQFTDIPAPYICVNDTVNILYSAKDPDGDSVVYNLVVPYSGGDSAKPIPALPNSFILPDNITYATNYSFNKPFGNGGVSKIDSKTGLVTLMSHKQGLFAVAVEVKEYRNGNLISITRRDVQIIAIPCPPNPIPVLKSTVNNTVQTHFEVNEGETISFPMVFKDDDSMYLSYTGDIFGGSNSTVPAPHAFLTSSSGDTQIKGNFVWNTSCDHGRKQPYLFIVKVKDSGCPSKTKNVTFSIKVNNFEGVASISGPDSVCQNETVVYNAKTQGSNSSLNWSTDQHGKIISGGSRKVNVLWDKTGNAKINVLEVSENGCVGDTFSKSVQIFEPIKADAGNNISICGGDTVNIGPSIVDPDAKYTWIDKGFIDNPKIPNPHFSIENNTNKPIVKTLRLKVERNKCISFDSVSIIIKPKPKIKEVVGDFNPCYHQTVNYYVNSSIGSHYQWQVTGGDIIGNDNEEKVNVYWTETSNTFVQIIEKNIYGCLSDPFQQAINVLRPEIDTVIGSPVVCPNSARVDYWVKDVPGSKFYWNVSGGIQVEGKNSSHIKVNWGDSGSAFVSVVEQDFKGCLSDTVKFPVLISYKLRTSSIFGDSNLCEYTASEPYSVFRTNGSYYNWSVNGGILSSKNGKAQVNIDWGIAGKALISVLESSYDSVNGKQCIGDTVYLPVKLNPNPNTSEISGVFELCQYLYESYEVEGFDDSYYKWEISPDINFHGQGTNTIQVDWTKADTFEITVTEISKDSCFGIPRKKTVIVHPKPVTSEITGNDTICQPNNSDIPYQVNGFNDSYYKWEVEGGSVVNNEGKSNVEVTWESKSSGKLSVTEISLFGCEGETKSMMVTLDFSDIQIEVVSTQEQREDLIELNWNIANKVHLKKELEIFKKNKIHNTWDLFEEVPYSTSSIVDSNVYTDLYSYSYKINSYNICNDKISTNLHRSILLKGFKKNEYTISLSWSPYKGWGETGIKEYRILRRMDGANNLETYKSLPQEDTTEVLNTGIDGYEQCYRIAAIKNSPIEVRSLSNEICFGFEALLYVPTAFTPDDDRLNDEFAPVGRNLKNYNLQIFNRWGEKVFESNSLEKGWNGNIGNSQAPSGVYVVLIKYQGYNEIKFYKGTVSLIR